MHLAAHVLLGGGPGGAYVRVGAGRGVLRCGGREAAAPGRSSPRTVLRAVVSVGMVWGPAGPRVQKGHAWCPQAGQKDLLAQASCGSDPREVLLHTAEQAVLYDLRGASPCSRG